MITGGKEFDQVSRDRLDGYKHALSESSIDIKDEYIVPGDFIYYEKTEKAIDKLLSLSDKPTAIVCASDPIAYCAYEALTRKGLKIPENISLTGFDNLQPPKYTTGLLPKLTTVNVDVKELARYTLEIIFQLMKDPKRIAWRYTLPVKLEYGKTTASLLDESGRKDALI